LGPRRNDIGEGSDKAGDKRQKFSGQRSLKVGKAKKSVLEKGLFGKKLEGGKRGEKKSKVAGNWPPGGG